VSRRALEKLVKPAWAGDAVYWRVDISRPHNRGLEWARHRRKPRSSAPTSGSTPLSAMLKACIARPSAGSSLADGCARARRPSLSRLHGGRLGVTYCRSYESSKNTAQLSARAGAPGCARDTRALCDLDCAPCKGAGMETGEGSQ
jgi:hypothetical protein